MSVVVSYASMSHQQHQRSSSTSGKDTDDKETPVSFTVDRKKAIVFQVGHLGERYQDWVYRPETGKPIFFSNTFCETFSKTKWWIIPLLWIPISALCIWHAGQTYKVDYTFAWPYFIVGAIFWSLIEYAVHRFLFHKQTSTYWPNTLHFLFHGCHHKFPMDDMRLVMPPAVAAPTALIIFGLECFLFGKPNVFVVFAGSIMGYVGYDCFHYHCHFSSKLPFFSKFKQNHMMHHYKDHKRRFGISTDVWDKLFHSGS